MHSARGDETPDVPEPHHGVVLPGEPPRWDDSPAGVPAPAWTPAEPPYGSYGPSRPQQYGPPGAVPDPFGPPAHGGQPEAGVPQYFAAGPGGPAAEHDATQLFPPYPQATPPPAQGDVEATQMLRPVPAALPGALPPEAPPLEAAPPIPPAALFGIRQGLPTDQQPHFQQPQQFQPQQPQPHFQAPPQLPYEHATQQLPRFTEPEPERTTPPSDYDHLYRQDTQPPRQQPQRQAPPQYRQASPQGPPPQYRQAAPYQRPYQQQPPYDEPEAPRRRLSPALLVALVVVGCALVGLAAGALMSGGDDTTTPAASSSSAAPSAAASASGSASPSTGGTEAESQAKALDTLLADSGSSRSSVISAVSSIGSCQNLAQAGSDLRAAAEQRNGLVTRLGQLSVDQLPDHQALTDALNEAWKASAAADTHYAAWADQAVSDSKVCKSGTAGHTGQTRSGDRESGTASTAKGKAVKLWNVIAKKYGLTERAKTQL